MQRIRLRDDISRSGRIFSNLSEAHAQIVIIDACRSTPLRLYRDGFDDFSDGLLTPTVPPFTPSSEFGSLTQGKFVSFAAAPGTKAQDGAGRNSPYVKAFLKTLKKNSGLELRTFFAQVKQEVYIETATIQRSWTTDDLVGNFYFKKK